MAVTLHGSLIWILFLAASILLADHFSAERGSGPNRLDTVGTLGLYKSWWIDWFSGLMIFEFMALGMIGLITEPPSPLRERLRKGSLYFKLIPIYLLAIFLWFPIATNAINIYTTSSAQYWISNSPLLFVIGMSVTLTVYIAGLARDWNQVEITQ